MIKASRKAEPDRLAREVRCVDAVDAMLRKALAADEAEGSSRTDGRVRAERVYEVPVKRPNETVPTNLRTDTFLDAMVSS